MKPAAATGAVTPVPARRQVDATAMDATDFAVALMGAADGTVMIYHRGDLVRARARNGHVAALADKAMDLSESNWACLVQRRIRGHDGQFEYLAVKRRRTGKGAR